MTNMNTRSNSSVEHTQIVKFYLVEQRLSDGSSVWNIRMGNIELHACSERDALAMVELIQKAVDDHSTDAVEVVGR